MRPDDRIRMAHMRDAAKEALAFAASASRQSLDADRKLALALVKDIEIIGEAAAKVGAEAKQSIPQIPWPAIIVMRHRLVHGYFDIDLDVVWATLQEDLPALVEALDAALKES